MKQEGKKEELKTTNKSATTPSQMGFGTQKD